MDKRKINRLEGIDEVTLQESENKKLIKTAFFRTLLFTQLVILVMSLVLCFFVVRLASELPDISFIKTIEPEQSTQIFDINDELVTEVVADEDRVYVAMEGISPHFVRAVIAIEDIRFYNHSGIDLKGTIRAFLNNLTGASSIQGGSTITQQLAKNWYLIPKKSLERKFLEALLASRIENNFSKKEILEKYMNLIYLGNRSYGIERAAQRYFGKSAKDLDLAESSLLAALIKAPEKYSPYANYEKSRERQKLVLERMQEYGFITAKQEEEVLKDKVTLKPREIAFSKYQYFVDHVLYLLRKRYGESLVRKGGLKIYTTLDPEVQEIATKTIVEGVKKLPRYTRVREGALVSIDVKTGYIKALVGGVNYDSSQFNRATQAKRATGSGFKPIVYLTAFRLGLINPKSYVVDAPIAYRTKWNVWCPHNWDGRYMGRMTVRKALTLSRNTPTVRVALEAGLDRVIETARLLGIKSHMDRGYSIVLGSAGITPLEVATAYSTIARDGVYLEPTAIRRVIDSKGNLLEANKRQPIRVIGSKFVRLLVSILIDVVEKGTGRQARLEGRPVAGKTGTTDDFKDVWFNGFTPDTVTTIWLGNDENESLNGIWSSNCARLWKNFSKDYYELKNIPPEPFKQPEPDFEAKKKEEEKELYDRPVITPPRNYKPKNTVRPRVVRPGGKVYRQRTQQQSYPYYRTQPAQPTPSPQNTYRNYNRYNYTPRQTYRHSRPAVRPRVYRYNRR